MSVRRTSLDAYNEIKENGLIKGLQWKIYAVIAKHGPLTERECWSQYFHSYQRPSITPRFSELEDLGVISSAEERECRITGRVCISWQTTERLPKKVEKKETKTEKIKRLEARVAELENIILSMKKAQGELW